MSTNRTSTGVEHADPDGARLERARGRRIELYSAMRLLEVALARPASPDGWPEVVGSRLNELRAALDAHIDAVEGPDGLLAEVREKAPRLAAATAALVNQHVALLARCDEAAEALQADPDDAPGIRRRITSLLGELALHRQHGADLVYDAYNVDIGAAN